MAYYKKNTLSIETMDKNVPKDDKRSFKISSFREFNYCQKQPGVIKAWQFIGGLLEDGLIKSTTLQFPKTIANPVVIKQYIP